MNKIEIARCQLGTALDLFLRDLDPVAVHCLACGAGEILESLADCRSFASCLASAPSTPFTLKEIRRVRNQFWNAFKHMTAHSGQTRDDQWLLDCFSDLQNDGALFIGWSDYVTIAGKLPIAAQVFLSWAMVMMDDGPMPDPELVRYRKVFPRLAEKPRREQKILLRQAVMKYQSLIHVRLNLKTEDRPLVYANSYDGKGQINWPDASDPD